MNDPSEMIFAKSLIEKILRTHPQTRKWKLSAPFFSGSFYPYVLCFSKKSTIASQWVRYADGGRGVAIEFDQKAFQLGGLSAHHRWGEAPTFFWMGPVLYEAPAQSTLLKSALRDWLSDEMVKHGEHDFDEVSLGNALQRAAYHIKSDKFKREQEVRIILEPSLVTDHPSPLAEMASKAFALPSKNTGQYLPRDDAGVDHPLLSPQVEFRATKDAILPFFRLDISPKVGAIQKIILGPKNVSERGVIREFLQSRKYHNVKVVEAGE